MKIINRIYDYINFKDIKPVSFEKRIGLSNGYLSKQLKRNANLGESIINKIIENCPEINPNWLLTGRGKMFKEKTLNNSTDEAERQKNDDYLSNKIKLLEENIRLLKENGKYKDKEINELKQENYKLRTEIENHKK